MQPDADDFLASLETEAANPSTAHLRCLAQNLPVRPLDGQPYRMVRYRASRTYWYG